MLISKQCKGTFEDCVKKLSDLIRNSGAEIFCIVDHSNNAKKVGLSLEPTLVIYFGNPKVGTLVMMKNRSIAYELPLRILVWVSNGITMVGYKKPSEIAREYGIEVDEVIKKMDAFMENIISDL